MTSMHNPGNGTGIVPARLLLPGENTDWRKWACVACDQYTSQPEYWRDVAQLVGQELSTLHMILPECELPAAPERIEQIHQAMRDMEGKLRPAVEDGYVLLERMTTDGMRLGLVCCVDLEQYAYDGRKTVIRPTEETVASRLPPRLAVRNGALLESSHVMLLVDDVERTVIEPLYQRRASLPLLYDFDLMMDSGHVRGWAVTEKQDKQQITDALLRLKAALGADPLLLAVGDGNHSLATAKAYWEQVKTTLNETEQLQHPARYAMVELVNIHDPALVFEPIHRVLKGMAAAEVMADFVHYSASHGIRHADAPADGLQEVRFVSSDAETPVYVAREQDELPVAMMQEWLDDLLARHPELSIDYIHGDDVLRRLSQQEKSMGVLLPVLHKRDFFPAIEQLGILPRKTFSMGHAQDKRFYMECRKIQ